jgi:phage tail sheath protein FI
MPAALTYPGVYIEEIPSGVRTITGVATSITAFVGYTLKGDLNRAVRIQNFGDFERQYGGLDRDSLVSYAIQQFFLNGGSDAYVVRVSKGGKIAEVTLKDYSNISVLRAMAINPGAWGNDIGLDVDYDTRNPESEFNLIVTRYETSNNKQVPAEIERHINLSMDSSSPTYAVDVVNASSRLIRLERKSGLGYDEPGWSQSGNLSVFPDLEGLDTISGTLNKSKPFSIHLASKPVNIDSLIAALNNAISAAGLSDQISVERVDAMGNPDSDGNFIRLTLVAGYETTNERSTIEILNSPTKDAAPKLRLGLANGGRERDGSSHRRPVQTGTCSGDLSAILDSKTPVGGTIKITITNQGSTAEILHSTPIDILDITPGPDLPKKLQEMIRNLDSPATKGAVVQLSGPILRVVTSADTPNASISLEDLYPLDLQLDDKSSPNVQQYRLGTGTTFGFQTGADYGSDGGLPTAAEILGSPGEKTGIYALLDVDLFNILSLPETSRLANSEALKVISDAAAFCEQRRAFFIIDPDPKKGKTDIAEWSEKASNSRNAAVFFPQIRISDPLNQYRLRDMPPSGAMAGIFARTDSQRGIWKAPAGTEALLNGAQSLSQNLTDMENGPLNQKGVNCIRSFPVYGIIAWGARTRRGADEMADEYKYIPIRRLALYLEESLYRGLKWVVFEPNDEPLWSQIRLNVGAFMQNLFRQGAFQGKTPRDAYFVKCDRETTTQAEVNLGIVNVIVGFAPLKPAEFVVIKIQQMAGQIQT